MRSVRARAALGATVVVALALIGAGLSVLLVLRANLTDQAGLQAEVVAREVAGQLALGVPYDRLEMRDEEDHPVQVTDEEGRVVAVSKDLRAISGTGTDRVTPVPSPTAGQSDGGSGDDDGSDDDGGDDDDGRGTPGRGEVDSDEPDFGNGTADVDGDTADYRFASVRATTPDGVTLTVHAGAPLAAEQEAVGTVRGAMLIGLPLMLLVVAGVTWLVTRRALRPVEGIRREMAAITASEDLVSGYRSPARATRSPGWPVRPMRRSPLWRPPSTGSGGSSRTPRTNCAARSPPCAPSWRWARLIRSCWTCRARSPTPYGSRRWPPISCCWPGWTRGSGRAVRRWTWARWSARRSRSAVVTGSR